MNMDTEKNAICNVTHELCIRLFSSNVMKKKEIQMEIK